MNRQHTGTVLRLVMSIALLVLLFALIDREALLKTILSVDPILYTVGFVAFIGTILTWTLRWHLFISAAGESIGFSKALVTLTISMFFSLFLPTIVGTDVGRVYELGRDNSYRKTNVVSSVLLDRLMGLITISLMALTALIVGSEFAADRGIVLTVVGTLVTLIGVWAIVFNRRFESFIFKLIAKMPVINRFTNKLHEVYDALYQLHRKPRLMFMAGVVSFVNSLCTILATLFAARSLNITIDPIYFFIFMPIIWIIMTIPISLSGLGVREGAFVFFFSQVGVAPADAIAISLLYYSYNIIIGGVGGLLILYSSLTLTQRRKNVEV